MKHLLTICLLLIGATDSVLAVTVDDLNSRRFIHSDGTSLPYRLFVPPDYNGEVANRYPLVLFLHGAGERGTDNRSQLRVHPAPLEFLSESHQAKHPTFMVAPQCPNGASWFSLDVRNAVFALVESLMEEFKLDSDRIYVTGLSMGGFGTTAYLSGRPDLFAAGICISAPLVMMGQPIAGPVWIFQGAKDWETRMVRRSVDMGRRLGTPIIYTEFANGFHEIWNTAYQTPNMLDWLMAQRRGEPSEIEFGVEITSPTTGFELEHRPNKISLSGTAHHPFSALDAVHWINHTTGHRGTAEGIAEWTVENIPLLPNADNEITVWAVGPNIEGNPEGTTTLADNLRVLKPSIDWLPQSRAIGVNFEGTQSFGVDGRLEEDVTAGFFPQRHWNNAAGAEGRLDGLVDSTGETQLIQVEYQSGQGTGERGYTIDFVDSRMVDGVLLAGVDDPIILKASEVSYPVYDVLLYFSPWWGAQPSIAGYPHVSIEWNGKTLDYTVDDANYYGFYQEASVYNPDHEPGNYVRLRGLTNRSFEIKITGSPVARAALSAIQVVPMPKVLVRREPAALVMTWPEVFGHAILDSCSDPTQDAWTPLFDLSPVRRGGAMEVRVDTAPGVRFFRLRFRNGDEGL